MESKITPNRNWYIDSLDFRYQTIPFCGNSHRTTEKKWGTIPSWQSKCPTIWGICFAGLYCIWLDRYCFHGSDNTHIFGVNSLSLNLKKNKIYPNNEHEGIRTERMHVIQFVRCCQLISIRFGWSTAMRMRLWLLPSILLLSIVLIRLKTARTQMLNSSPICTRTHDTLIARVGSVRPYVRQKPTFNPS